MATNRDRFHVLGSSGIIYKGIWEVSNFEASILTGSDYRGKYVLWANWNHFSEMSISGVGFSRCTGEFRFDGSSVENAENSTNKQKGELRIDREDERRRRVLWSSSSTGQVSSSIPRGFLLPSFYLFHPISSPILPSAPLPLPGFFWMVQHHIDQTDQPNRSLGEGLVDTHGKFKNPGFLEKKKKKLKTHIWSQFRERHVHRG